MKYIKQTWISWSKLALTGEELSTVFNSFINIECNFLTSIKGTLPGISHSLNNWKTIISYKFYITI